MHDEIATYNNSQSDEHREICDKLAKAIDAGLPESESKIWHAHPVWFLDGNPIVGYSKVKAGIRLMFWSGQSFDEDGLLASGKFKAADITYTSAKDVKLTTLKRWLTKSHDIQWDYKNIVKRKGELIRLK